MVEVNTVILVAIALELGLIYAKLNNPERSWDTYFIDQLCQKANLLVK